MIGKKCAQLFLLFRVSGVASQGKTSEVLGRTFYWQRIGLVVGKVRTGKKTSLLKMKMFLSQVLFYYIKVFIVNLNKNVLMWTKWTFLEVNTFSKLHTFGEEFLKFKMAFEKEVITVQLHNNFFSWNVVGDFRSKEKIWAFFKLMLG